MNAPRSTYRLQIHEKFTLDDAAAQLPYLHRLGVDWVYLSPLLTAEEGSQHGYDVTDPTTVDASRGGPEALQRLSDAAHELGMGVLIDIVPNHQGVATPAQNPRWWSLLEEGQSSPWADAFDVDWPAGNGKVLLPVLGSANDVDKLAIVDGQLAYYEHRFPIKPGTANDGDDPQAVHERQNYELIDWRRGDSELNFRRFFSISTLAGVRVERPEIFDASHTEIRRWFAEGIADGLRVDHPDGLYDPSGYLEDLAGLTGGAYVLVEKILESGEELPKDWASAGTTGYDTLPIVDRLFTDPAGEQALSEITGVIDWHELTHGTKLGVARGSLLAETRRLVRCIPPDAGLDPAQAEEAIAELLASFSVYRTYLPQHGRQVLVEALDQARKRRPDLSAAYDNLFELLTNMDLEIAHRFQQTSGMVMAKGVEDCAFYRYTRLTSLTEVGADPSMFSITTEDFHAFMARRQKERPLAMNALTTHDTKRSEDTRARISVLSEVPDRWAHLIEQLKEPAPIPDGPLANLVWQAAVGAWPVSRDRLQAYAEKAAKEAGNSTSWTEPNEEFDAALKSAVDAVYDDPTVTRLIENIAAEIEAAGWSNSLSAKLVQLTIPGVPDVYQGTEFWDLSLVDPDNRRPVDYGSRSTALAEMDYTAELPELGPVGVTKMHLVSATLRVRRERPELFAGYHPVVVDGEAAEHVVAFDRGESPGAGAVTVVSRLPMGLAKRGGLGDTTITLPGAMTDALTGATFDAGAVPVADMFRESSVALLLPTSD